MRGYGSQDRPSSEYRRPFTCKCGQRRAGLTWTSRAPSAARMGDASLPEAGKVPYYAPSGYWPGWTIARGIVATANGGCTVDGFGGIHPFGNAPAITPTGYWPNWDIVRGIAVASGGTGAYTLDGFGGVHPAGGAPSLSVSGYWPNWDIAIDLVTAP